MYSKSVSVSHIFFRKRKHFVGDLSSTDFETPRKRHRNLEKFKQRLHKQKKVIHSLRGTVQRLRKRITSLKSLLKYFKDKCMISENSEAVIKVMYQRYVKNIAANSCIRFVFLIT